MRRSSGSGPDRPSRNATLAYSTTTLAERRGFLYLGARLSLLRSRELRHFAADLALSPEGCLREDRNALQCTSGRGRGLERRDACRDADFREGAEEYRHARRLDEHSLFHRARRGRDERREENQSGRQAHRRVVRVRPWKAILPDG